MKLLELEVQWSSDSLSCYGKPVYKKLSDSTDSLISKIVVLHISILFTKKAFSRAKCEPQAPVCLSKYLEENEISKSGKFCIKITSERFLTLTASETHRW